MTSYVTIKDLKKFPAEKIKTIKERPVRMDYITIRTSTPQKGEGALSIMRRGKLIYFRLLGAEKDLTVKDLEEVQKMMQRTSFSAGNAADAGSKPGLNA